MNNKRGSLLIITLTFILVFTLLGFGALRLAGNQNIAAENQKASAQAFWLADGAVQRAVTHLPKKLFTPSETVVSSTGEYDLESKNNVKKDENGQVIYTYKYQWIINTQGRVNGQARSIEAIVSALDTRFNIKTRGTIKDMDKCPQASIMVDCQLIQENQQFSLDTYFQGFNKDQIYGLADHAYVDPNNAGDVNPIENITLVTLVNNSSLNLTTDNIVGGESVFLIVDTTAASGNPHNPPSLRISGNGIFRGIIWVIGEAEFTGTAQVNGSILIEGDPSRETKILGNMVIEIDEQAVEEAVSQLMGGSLFPPQDPKMIAWKEI
ncbi:MAG: hypothetical protein JW847_01505 [Candidatus Omnitrophica bacterium]|nr:hypothetical protein [Candidatus Omnitrophota bacterium]